MVPAPPSLTAPNGHPVPHPSFIEVAKPYIFQQKIEHYLAIIGMTEAKEDGIRLQGVKLIDDVRKALQLPVRTFNTACVYYHKFRLLHSDSEYNLHEASLAALFTACKIEDTLKKSKEIICASFNLKLSPSEHLSPDDPQLEQPSKVIIGLERLMLEAAGFDFRNRQPQKLVIKLTRKCAFAKENVGRTAYLMSLDLYRTFAPLKQTTPAMAIACVELAARLHDANMTFITEEHLGYSRWHVTRAEVMETMLDLLDLYTHHRVNSLIGPNYLLDTYINVRIVLNQEASAKHLPRFTPTPSPASPKPANDTAADKNDGVSKSAKANATNGANKNASSTNGANTPSSIADNRAESVPPVPASGAGAGIGQRGLGGTVRFMLDPGRARDEQRTVGSYFKDEEEEYEIEVEVGVGSERGGGRGERGRGR
ncbi:cyclin [Phyllosticta citribraziliensis]|uniref:RNA polymerase II holoenzyme cyclin-like subunit n=1 Tax=Phyllosticta citribraziliensis TaxID=989973 RepID=A0ABR1LVW3_9PEZI